MNNQQFRRLLVDTPSASKDVSATAPPALGSRMRTSIPMTPRSVIGSSGVDFARQLREQSAGNGQTKKFRSSAAPKGTKLAPGYQDRTRSRYSNDEDEKASRVKALEDMVKLGQMEQSTFEALRDEIVGGDVQHTHLVKGLDYRLLARVRAGEDVLNESRAEEKDEPDLDTDEAFESLESKEVVPLAREKREKKGEVTPAPPLAGKKRTRDEILRELKSSRLQAAAAKKAAQPALSNKFRKIGQKREGSRIERDKKGREVLLTVDEEGNVKRKVRRTDVKANGGTQLSNGLLMPEKDATPLGMEAPVDTRVPTSQDDDESTDIFEGVGTDYDPLGLANADEGSSEDDDTDPISKALTDSAPARATDTSPSTDMPPPPPPPPKSSGPRNYFAASSSATVTNDMDVAPSNPLKDPSILAALKKASSIALPSSDSASAAEADAEVAKLARHRALLSGHDRDAEDLDFGFGSSRFEDQEDGENRTIKLAQWNGEGGDEDRERGGKNRKRGPKKKKKGDKDSAKDVIAAMERRKEAGKGEGG